MFSRSVCSETHLRVLCFSQACAAELLASALESLWDVKEFLEDKTKANIMPLFHSGNKEGTRNYRSVSLTSFSRKLLKQIIK